MSIEELDNQVKEFVHKVTTTGQLIDHLKDVQSSYEQVLATFEIINHDKKNINTIAENIQAKIIKLTENVKTIHQEHLQTLTELKDNILHSQSKQTEAWKNLIPELKSTHQKALTELETIATAIQSFIKMEQAEIKKLLDEFNHGVKLIQSELKEIKDLAYIQADQLSSLKKEVSKIQEDHSSLSQSLVAGHQQILAKVAALHHRIENPPKKKFLGIF